MNTPSKEALEAAEAVFGHWAIQATAPSVKIDFAEIIDRHFEPLRRDNATLAGRLTAAELERDSLGARAEQAEARVNDLAEALREMVDAQDATLAVLQTVHTEIDRLEKAMRTSREVLASHAAGEPAKHPLRTLVDNPEPCLPIDVSSIVGDTPAKHPDTEGSK